MSYRVYLELFTRKGFDRMRKNVARERRSEEGSSVYLREEAYRHIELRDDTISHLKGRMMVWKTFQFSGDEYPPYNCNKSTLGRILEHYASFLRDSEEGKHEQCTDAMEGLLRKKHGKREVRAALDVLARYRLYLAHESQAMRAIGRRPLELHSTGMFKYDYFELSALYHHFDFGKGVMILTHG